MTRKKKEVTPAPIAPICPGDLPPVRVLRMVVSELREPHSSVIRTAEDAEPLLRSLFGDAATEEFWLLILDAKNRVNAATRISVGCLTWSVVHPREVFAPAVREQAAAIIIAHNHPSGDPTPSMQDIEVTQRLARVGETLGIPLIDHIVVGRSRCVSLRSHGHMGGGEQAA